MVLIGAGERVTSWHKWADRMNRLADALHWTWAVPCALQMKKVVLIDEYFRESWNPVIPLDWKTSNYPQTVYPKGNTVLQSAIDI
jgi:hypothetical protein